MTFRFGFGRSLGILGACMLYFGAGCGTVTSGTPDGRGPEQEPPPGASAANVTFGASGKRLAVMAYKSNGAIAVSHLFDEALGTECAFATDERGVARCFPTTRTRVVYLDENCKMPAIYLIEGVEGDWVVERDEQGETSCPGELPTGGALYRIGELVYEDSSRSDVTLYAPLAGQCQPTGPEAKTNPHVHRLVPQASDELVSGRIVNSAATSGYRVSSMVAEDGTVLNLGVRLDDGTPCALQRDGVCIPEPFATTQAGLSLDSSCSQPALTSASPEKCGTTRYGLLSAEGESTRLAELTHPRAVFSRNLVLPVPADGGDLQYTCEVASYAVEAFAPLAEVEAPKPAAELRLLGDGALRVPAFELRGDAGTFLVSPAGADPGFTDGGEPCSVTTMADGSLHCLRGDDQVIETGYFVDSQCLKRAYRRLDSKTRPLDEALIARSYVETWGEGARIESFTSVERHNAGVFQYVNQACQPADAIASREELGEDLSAALVAAAPIPLDAFPLVKLERL